MRTSHVFISIRPYDRGYHWGRRNSRCRYCHIDEDHAVNDRCTVLVARLAAKVS
jgi:hypothetical protein